MKPRLQVAGRVAGAGLLAVAMLVSACATKPTVTLAQLGAGNERLELTQTAFFPTDDTAAGALATLLYTDGVDIGPEQVAPRLGAKTDAVSTESLLAAARTFARLPYRLQSQPDALFRELGDRQPVLVRLGGSGVPAPHAVAIGYDPASETVLLRAGREGRVVLPLAKFLTQWQAAESFALVVSTGTRVPVTAVLDRWIAAIEAASAAFQTALAVQAAQGASQRWPQEVVSWVALGNAHYAHADWLAAQAAYGEALKRKPVNPVVQNNLARVLLERQCIDLAEQAIARALAGETDPVLIAAYRQTEDKISRFAGTAIYCPPPDDVSAPNEYEIAPLNPEKPPATRARPKAPPKSAQ